MGVCNNSFIYEFALWNIETNWVYSSIVEQTKKSHSSPNKITKYYIIILASILPYISMLFFFLLFVYSFVCVFSTIVLKTVEINAIKGVERCFPTLKRIEKTKTKNGEKKYVENIKNKSERQMIIYQIGGIVGI